MDRSWKHRERPLIKMRAGVKESEETSRLGFLNTEEGSLKEERDVADVRKETSSKVGKLGYCKYYPFFNNRSLI